MIKLGTYEFKKDELFSVSIYASRAIKFFLIHPEAFNLIYNNISETNKTLCQIFFDQGITNRNKPYSLATVAILRNFVDALNRTKIKDNKNKIDNE